MNAQHEILRQFPYAIYIVGVRGKDDKESNLLVASWVTQCSFHPPLLLVALRGDCRSLELLRAGKVFSVNLVEKGEKEVVRQFVKPSDRVGDKHAEGATRPGKETRAPILDGAFASLECRVRDIIEPGDHAIVLGEVVGAEKRRDGEHLMCSDMHWTYGG